MVAYATSVSSPDVLEAEDKSQFVKNIMFQLLFWSSTFGVLRFTLISQFVNFDISIIFDKICVKLQEVFVSTEDSF